MIKELHNALNDLNTHENENYSLDTKKIISITDKDILTGISKIFAAQKPFDSLIHIQRRLNLILNETDHKYPKTYDIKVPSSHDPKTITVIPFKKSMSKYHNEWFSIVEDDIQMDDITAYNIITVLNPLYAGDSSHDLMVIIAGWVNSLNRNSITKTTAKHIGSIVSQKAFNLQKKPSSKKNDDFYKIK